MLLASPPALSLCVRFFKRRFIFEIYNPPARWLDRLCVAFPPTYRTPRAFESRQESFPEILSRVSLQLKVLKLAKIYCTDFEGDTENALLGSRSPGTSESVILVSSEFACTAELGEEKKFFTSEMPSTIASHSYRLWLRLGEENYLV